MATIYLTGHINEAGELEAKLPAGLPPGEVYIILETVEDSVWTDDEIAEMMRVEPMTGKEIVTSGLTGGWRDQGITDSAEWVEAQRRRRREQQS